MDADVDWHKPVISHMASSSDKTRGVRQIEEPALTVALWKETPTKLRWSLSADALQHIVQTTDDPEEQQWAVELLERQVRVQAKAKATAGWGMGARHGKGSAKGTPGRGEAGQFFQDSWSGAAGSAAGY